MRSYTREIADFASNVRLPDVPPEVIGRTKKLMLDGFGCALYATDARWTQILAGVVKRLEPHGGQASIWGRGETASAASATLINGTMVQAYELDEGNSNGAFHGSAVLLPAALAAAEYVGADKVSGGRLLLAVIAGYEVGPRIARCVNGEQLIKSGWHAPAVVSAFPAAIAAGVLLGLNTDQFFHALGIAGTQASGLMAAQFGSMVKRMQCAKNSQSGLYAALLAANGFTGIEDIFEEKYGGFCSTFAHGVDNCCLPALVHGLGKEWHTMQAAIKLYACRGGNHAAVNAIEELMKESGLKAEDVAEITIGVTEAAVLRGGWSPYMPKGLTGAQMHIGFCVATQLIEGEVFVNQMVESNVARPDLVELANRIKVVRSEERESRGFDYSRGADVEVKLKNGRVLTKTVDYSPGTERRPLTDEQITKKFRSLASGALSHERMAEFEMIIENLERAPSISPLINVLRAKS